MTAKKGDEDINGNDEPMYCRNRVTQLDALDFDEEVLRIMKNQLVNCFKYLPVGVQGRLEPELDAVLQFIILHLSVSGMDSTFGQQLLGVTFSHSKRKSAILVTLVPIIVQYLNSRIGDLASRTGNQAIKNFTSSTTHWSQVAFAVGSLINLVLFLRDGKYPTLMYRLVGLRMMNKSRNVHRQVGYSHMTRELIWHGFIELLVFVVPLINYHYLKRHILGLFAWSSMKSRLQNKDAEKSALTLQTRCAVCSQRPVLPHNMGCYHIFCFYCLNANILADSNFPCPLCGHEAQGLKSAKQVVITVV